MATKGNALGDYLRARRGQVRPEDVGLIAGARRRVRGLRREELATLAGISSEYYLRLEQGRDQNPSAQILDAIARALQLDIKGTEYLHQLASPPGARREQLDPETTADGTDELIDQFSMPAIVVSRCQGRVSSTQPRLTASNRLRRTDPASAWWRLTSWGKWASPMLVSISPAWSSFSSKILL